MQTNLKSDDFCGYNQSASPFFQYFQPDQYENTYVVGEVGVIPNGGAPGSYVRPDVVDISSFLSGRDDVLSRCVPPTPSLDSLNEPILHEQNKQITTILLPKYTREKRSQIDLSSKDFNRWQPNIQDEPQNLRFVIEGFANSDGRIGFNTRNYTKHAWEKNNSYPYINPQGSNQILGSGPFEPCETILRPGLTSDESVTGYPGVNPITRKKDTDPNFKAPGKPPMQPDYPFIGITSQQVYGVGAASGGPQFNYGPNYDMGKQPVTTPTVIPNGGALQ